MGKPGDELSDPEPSTVSRVLPWKKLRPRSSNWLNRTLIFVSQYELTLQANLRLECTHLPKSKKA